MLGKGLYISHIDLIFNTTQCARCVCGEWCMCVLYGVHVCVVWCVCVCVCARARTFLDFCLSDHLRNSRTHLALKSRSAMSVADTIPSMSASNSATVSWKHDVTVTTRDVIATRHDVTTTRHDVIDTIHDVIDTTHDVTDTIDLRCHVNTGRHHHKN